MASTSRSQQARLDTKVHPTCCSLTIKAAVNIPLLGYHGGISASHPVGPKMGNAPLPVELILATCVGALPIGPTG